MDRIIESFLAEFSSNQDLQDESPSVQFEHFANYCVVLNENGVTDFDISSMHTGNSTQGIDGVAIEVNGKFVESIDEISQSLSFNQKLDVSFVFIQAKTSDSFSNAELLNFLSFVHTFFTDNARQIFTTPEMCRFLDMKEYIYENARYLTIKNPQVKLYYFALGDWNEKDINLQTVIRQQKCLLEDTRLFSNISFSGCGIIEIQKMYRKSKDKLEATIVFEKRLVMFEDSTGTMD